MPPEAVAVLGIDAAWTDVEPSGVALLVRSDSRWKALRVAPSYDAFSRGDGWSDHCSGSAVDVKELLETCDQLTAGAQLKAVAVDMPLSTKKIVKRRFADDVVSRQFGHRQCAVHSPTPGRPGMTGHRLHQGFANAGYTLVAVGATAEHALLEVYPHVALLGLTGRTKRLPYKAGKTTSYWPGTSLQIRKQRLLNEWKLILDFLQRDIDNIDLPLPDPETHTLQSLKHFEDALDGLICAWVATRYLEKAAVALGDQHAAIWIPTTSMQFAKDQNGA